VPICFFEKESAEIVKASDLSVLASCTQKENPSVQIKNMRKAGICLNPSYELDSTSKGIFFNTPELRKINILFATFVQQNTHCTENPIYEFPEMKLPGLIPNSSFYVYVRDFIFQGSVCLFGYSKIGKPIL
jgi:hypothetical protein